MANKSYETIIVGAGISGLHGADVGVRRPPGHLGHRCPRARQRPARRAGHRGLSQRCLPVPGHGVPTFAYLLCKNLRSVPKTGRGSQKRLFRESCARVRVSTHAIRTGAVGPYGQGLCSRSPDLLLFFRHWSRRLGAAYPVARYGARVGMAPV